MPVQSSLVLLLWWVGRPLLLTSVLQPAQTWKTETNEWRSESRGEVRALRMGELRKAGEWQGQAGESRASPSSQTQSAPSPRGGQWGGRNWLYLSPQLQLLSLLSASSTFTNFSIEETLQAGPDTVFLILLGASRPQPGEHPDSRSGWKWRSWPQEQPPGRGAGRKCRLGLGG